MSETAVSPAKARTDGRGQRSAQEVLDSPEFKHLVARRWRTSMILLVLLFVSYYGYIVLVATNKEFVATKIGVVTTLAIPLGILAIVFAWALTAFYVRWANVSYDPEVERLRGQIRH